jgi:hypothetical protein
MAQVVTAPPMSTFTGDCRLEVHNCPQCGLVYAIPYRLAQEARKLGHGKLTWRCPAKNCANSLGYHGKNEAEKLEERLRWARDDAARAQARADQAEASARGQKAAKTRARNERDVAKRKAAAALCPVPGCGRKVRAMASHIANKHPGYDPAPQHDHDGEG